MQEKVGKNPWIVNTTGLQNRHWSKMYRNSKRYFVEQTPFEKYCVLLSALLNQGEFSTHFSFIGLNDADFNPLCLSNTSIFSWILSQKNHVQVFFDKKVIRIKF